MGINVMTSKVKEHQNNNKKITCILYFLSDPKTCVLKYSATEQFTSHFLISEGGDIAEQERIDAWA